MQPAGIQRRAAAEEGGLCAPPHLGGHAAHPQRAPCTVAACSSGGRGGGGLMLVHVATQRTSPCGDAGSISGSSSLSGRCMADAWPPRAPCRCLEALAPVPAPLANRGRRRTDGCDVAARAGASKHSVLWRDGLRRGAECTAAAPSGGQGPCEPCTGAVPCLALPVRHAAAACHCAGRRTRPTVSTNL
jgi:hypothetical protein